MFTRRYVFDVPGPNIIVYLHLSLLPFMASWQQTTVKATILKGPRFSLNRRYQGSIGWLYEYTLLYTYVH